MKTRGEGFLGKLAALAAALLMAGLVLPGCDRGTDEGASQRTLLLYCGAGMRPAAAEAAEAFRAETGVTVQCDYAGGGKLISRIKLIRQGDLYMPGDVWYLDELARQEDLVESKQRVTYFVPAIVVAKGNPANVRGLADLARPGVRVALGDPRACQIGRITQEIFAKNGIDAAAVEKNTVLTSVTVNELCVWIQTQRVDATVAWDAVAAQFSASADVIPIPRGENIISNVAIGVLKCSQDKALAQQFADFLAGPKGQAIFAKHHYRVTTPEE